MKLKIFNETRFILFLFICIVILNGLSGCGKKNKTIINSPIIRLSDDIVSWDKINKADGYTVYIGNEEYNTSELCFSLDFLEQGSYGIAVRAYMNNELEKVYSKNSNIVNYEVKSKFDKSKEVGSIKLQTPVIKADDKIVAWDVIHYATSYFVYVNDCEKEEVITNYYAMDTRKAGTFTIKIKAVSTYIDYGASDLSNEVSITIEKAYSPISVCVTDEPYNAKGDGKTNDRSSIQKAIDFVSDSGGGKVIIPKNKVFLTGNIFLKDNVTLFLEENSMLKQSANQNDYVEPDGNGGYRKKSPDFGGYSEADVTWAHTWKYNYPLVSSLKNARNVKVVGNGTLKCMEWTTEEDTMRIVLIGFYNSNYIEVTGVTITDYTGYAISAYGCKYGLFMNNTIKNPIGGCNDGISTYNSQRMRFTGNYIRSGDDSLYVGTLNDPCGRWYKGQDTLLSATNFEVDNNDCNSGSDATKGFALFTWGCGTEHVKKYEISDLYIHNNKFNTVGIWSSSSYPWGEQTICPVKNVRWYDNEIDIVQNGFYYDGISDMNYFQSMHKMINGDFEYCGIGCWTTKGSAGLKNEENNNYGYIKDFEEQKSEIYQGLWLNGGEKYLFNANVMTNGDKCAMFVRNIDSQTIIAKKEFSNTSWESVSLSFNILESNNYQIGIMNIDNGGWAFIDNASVVPSYNEYLLYDAGSSVNVSIDKDQNSDFVQGMNLLPSKDSNIEQNQLLNIAYFCTLNEIKDNEGYLSFAPLIQRNSTEGWITVADGQSIVNYKDLSVKDGNIILIFKLQVPKNFAKSTDAIVPRLRFMSGIDISINRLIITTNDMDYSCFNSYKIASRSEIDNGTLAIVPEGVFYSYKPNYSFDVKKDNDELLQGWNMTPCLNIESGQILKVAYYMNIESITDLDSGIIKFDPIAQRNDGNWTCVAAGYNVLNYNEIKDISGKVLLIYVIQVYEDYDSNLDYIVPRLFLHSSIKGVVDKIVIANGNYDFGNSDYEIGYEIAINNMELAVKNEWVKSSKKSKIE